VAHSFSTGFVVYESTTSGKYYDHNALILS